MDLHVFRATESKKVSFGISSVCLSVCLSVWLSVCRHDNSKNNGASSTKFGMRSYMIKFSAGIAYEQNRPTGVASALIAQFVFLVKSDLKMRCTTIFSRQKLLQVTIHNFWCKNFVIAPQVWPLP